MFEMFILIELALLSPRDPIMMKFIYGDDDADLPIINIVYTSIHH